MSNTPEFRTASVSDMCTGHADCQCDQCKMPDTRNAEAYTAWLTRKTARELAENKARLAAAEDYTAPDGWAEALKLRNLNQ